MRNEATALVSAYGIFKFICLIGFSLSYYIVNAQVINTRDSIDGHRIIPFKDLASIELVKSNIRYDLERYPWYKYEVDSSLINPIKLGDSIPEEVMNLPLWVVQKDNPSDTITLKDLPRDKMLIIDFWAEWCSPCVESMVKWEEYADSLREDLYLLGVHINHDFYAYPFVKEKKWDSPSVIGLNARVLNRYFFYPKNGTVSRMAWIKDGKLIAITGTKGYDLQLVKDVIDGKEVEIPQAYEWTYSIDPNTP